MGKGEPIQLTPQNFDEVMESFPKEGDYRIDTLNGRVVKLLWKGTRSKFAGHAPSGFAGYSDVYGWQCEDVLFGTPVWVDTEDLSKEALNEMEVLAWASK